MVSVHVDQQLVYLFVNNVEQYNDVVVITVKLPPGNVVTLYRIDGSLLEPDQSDYSVSFTNQSDYSTE